MSKQNPYAFSNGAVAAIDAPVSERTAFLQRTYTWLFGGILMFAATLWACGNIAPVQSVMVGIWRTIAGAGFVGMLIYLAMIMGGGWVVQRFSTKSPLNAVLYFSYSALFGLLLGPIVLMAAEVAPNALTEASISTVVIFGGLTGYVFWSKKDFNFLGGILNVCFFALLGLGLCSALFGFSLGSLFSMVAVLLYAGYTLYHTSEILHRYPTNMHVSAACVLFVDFIMLFQQLLMLFLSRDD